ncbi:MAG: hypothetical protein CL484_03075 [Acidobacteria bacterium]|nr:hypothetical protein [Acidobacteriota bacterium]
MNKQSPDYRGQDTLLETVRKNALAALPEGQTPETCQDWPSIWNMACDALSGRLQDDNLPTSARAVQDYKVKV